MHIGLSRAVVKCCHEQRCEEDSDSCWHHAAPQKALRCRKALADFPNQGCILPTCRQCTAPLLENNNFQLRDLSVTIFHFIPLLLDAAQGLRQREEAQVQIAY